MWTTTLTAGLLLKILTTTALLAIKVTGELTDLILLQLIGKGREEALEVFYNRYKGLIYSLTLKMVGDSETAEEITLDTFERVWNNARSFTPERASGKTWLVSMARNRAIDSLRRRGSRPDQTPGGWSSEDLDNLADQTDMEADITDRDLRRKVITAIRDLSPELKEPLALAYLGGYSHSEIAERLDLPLGTVKTRIRAAVHLLRERFSDEPEI